MDTFVASSSSLSPPTKLRPRGSSTSVPLSIQPVSLAQVSASSSSSSASSTATARYGILEVPQTPSALVRKSTAPTTIVQDLDQLQEEDDHHNHNEHGFHSLAVPPTRQSSTGSSFSASSSSTSLSAPSSPGRHHSSSSRHHAHSNNKHSHRSHGHSRTRSRQYHADHRAASASYLAPPASIPRHAVSSYAHLDDDLEGGDDTALGSRARALLIGAAPSRPMLSVLLSLGASALPPFVPGSSSSSRRREKSPSSMMMTRKPSTASSRRRRGSNHPPTSATNSGFWTPTSSREHHPHRSGAGSSSSNGTRSASRNASARSSLDDDFPSTPFSSRFVVPPTPISLRRSSGVTTSRSRAAKLVGSSFYGPILFLIALFVATLIPIGLGVWSLPLGSYMSSGSAPASFPPKTMKEVTALAMSVRQYAVSSSGSRFHVMFVLSITAIWMHAWSIPGSVVINVIAGTLYSMSSSLSSASTFGIDGLTGALVRQREYLPWGGMIGATLHMTLLTTLGSLAASALSMPLTALVKTFFPRALDATRTALEGPSSSSSSSSSAADSSSSAVFEKHGSAAGAKKDDTPTWVRLTVMRLVGVVPWSGINVACGVVGVKWWDCFLGSFIGTMPWTAVTCQVRS
ncbi:hypothetical protein DL93DRAFT_995916 [Clavulina sp. PMI_390]|nr:hypothetical protein DL93DRAFT_995916 [Clavulina sp. PMI_390]